MAAGETMQGRRVDDVANPREAHPILEPGDYRRTLHPEHGEVWECCVPSGEQGNLAAHQVTEHEDRTITVSPSILIRGGAGMADELWHGYLERGVWREV